jgi:hypothetical protein
VTWRRRKRTAAAVIVIEELLTTDAAVVRMTFMTPVRNVIGGVSAYEYTKPPVATQQFDDLIQDRFSTAAVMDGSRG